MMHYLVLVALGVLAAIGLLTVIAIATVIRFGDDQLSKLKAW